MKKTADTESVNHCEHCRRTFIRSCTLLKHICEPKRRWLDRDQPANRIAFAAWQQFYTQYHPSKKKLDIAEFIASAYYTAFVKFGIYCRDVKVLNPMGYCNYLLKEKVPIDNWAADTSYTAYLVSYLRTEDCLDAVQRSLENMLDVAQAERIQLGDVFNYVSANKLCQYIASGRISPWLMYHSKTGAAFLSKLNSDQTSVIFEYIHPERWQIKFLKNPEDVAKVQDLIRAIPGL